MISTTETKLLWQDDLRKYENRKKKILIAEKPKKISY